MACCALAVILLLQLLAPVRWLRGTATQSIAEETNWQLRSGATTTAPVESISWPRRYTRILFPIMGVELGLLGVLLWGH